MVGIGLGDSGSLDLTDIHATKKQHPWKADQALNTILEVIQRMAPIVINAISTGMHLLGEDPPSKEARYKHP